MATQIYAKHSNIIFYEFSIEYELSYYMQIDCDEANRHFLLSFVANMPKRSTDSRESYRLWVVFLENASKCNMMDRRCCFIILTF